MTQHPNSEDMETELGDLVSHIRVSAMPSELEVDTQFVGLEDFIPHEGRMVNQSNVSNVRSRVFRFESGDVLYGRLRPYLRKAAVADFSGCGSGEIIVLRCSERILPRYLLTLLLSEDFTHFVNSRARGDRPRTSFATIASYRFSLPSLETQRDVCFRDIRLAEAVTKLDKISMSLSWAAESLLDQMRSDLIWEPQDDSKLVPLESLVKDIDYGTAQRSTYEGLGTPVLRIPNIASSGEIDSRDLKYSSLSQREIEKYSLKPGDILLIRSNGSLSLVGRAAKVNVDHEGYAFAGYLLRMRPQEDVLSDYLLQLFGSTGFRHLVQAASRSSTGINNLSAGRLATFNVPIQSPESQARIVDILTSLQSALTSLFAELTLARSRAKTLQEAARRRWLGLTRLEESSRSVNKVVEDVGRGGPDHLDIMRPKANESIEELVIHLIDSRPVDVGSFATQFEDFQADYDVIRDAVFEMVTAEPPRLLQVFDEESGSIVLRRPV